MPRTRLAASVALAFCILAVGGSGAAALTGCAQTGDYEGCCKVCDKGKACGDTCISESYTCHVGAGCACNA